MNRKAFTFLLRTAVLLLPLIAQGCNIFKEDMDDCYNGVTVTLRMDPQTSNISDAEAAVQDAVLYVFDSQGRFLERRATVLNQEETLWHPQAGTLSVVGWLNKASNTYAIPDFTSDMTRDDARIRLNITRATECQTPTDLFYGDVSVMNEGMTDEREEIFASRRTGAVTVTVRGLREYAGKYDNNFSVTVGSTNGAVDFYGQCCEPGTTHTPSAAFDSRGEFKTGVFNALPTENEAFKVSLWHGEAGLIYETDVDNDGKSFVVKADATENILIDFRTGISVTVQETKWGVSYPWKTHN